MDRDPSHPKFAIILVLLIISASFFGCGVKLLKSTWLRPTSIVEGAPDWWNLPAFSNEDLNASLTLMNDSNDVYLRFYSKDRHLAGRIKRAGLTVWLSERGDKKARIGIEFPIGMQTGGEAFRHDRFLPQGDLPPTEINEMLKLQSDDIIVLSNVTQDSGRKTPEQAAQMGIKVQLNSQENSVEYVLRLHMSQLPDWIRPGKQVDIQIYSPVVERPKFREEERRPEGSHGMPPMGGDFPGGGRGGQGGHRGEHPEGRSDMESRNASRQAIDYKFTLELALPATP